MPVEGGGAQDIGAQLPAVQVSCWAVVSMWSDCHSTSHVGAM